MNVAPEIKSIFGECLFKCEAASKKEVVEKAISCGTNLSGADLSGAYLSGTNLSGAYLSGAEYTNGTRIEKEPIQIIGGAYPILIIDTHIEIGCEFHSISDWLSLDDKRILEMDGKTALKFWRKWKEPLKLICKLRQG